VKNTILTITSLLALASSSNATTLEPLTDTTKNLKVAEKPAAKHWYESVSLKGYAQVRYNRFGESNPNLKCAQCDASWGNNSAISIRRARLVFSGQLSSRVYFYFQNDIAQTASAAPNGSAMSTTGALLNFTQIRDAYFDVNLNNSGTLRVRLGQSKVPFGFDNLQSSQVRISWIVPTQSIVARTMNVIWVPSYILLQPK
jgi:phosphate-selective porin